MTILDCVERSQVFHSNHKDRDTHLDRCICNLESTIREPQRMTVTAFQIEHRVPQRLIAMPRAMDTPLLRWKDSPISAKFARDPRSDGWAPTAVIEC